MELPLTDTPVSLEPDLDLLTPAEVGALLKIHPSKVYQLVSSAELPAVRLGKNVRIRRCDLLDYVRNRLQ